MEQAQVGSEAEVAEAEATFKNVMKGPVASMITVPTTPITTRPARSSMTEVSCPFCSNWTDLPSAPSFVYAIGRIEARPPLLSVEKELAQATGRSDAQGQTDRQTMHAVLSAAENRYLARQMCWVLSVEGLETYLLVPRDSNDLHLLVESLRPTPSPIDVDVVIGLKGPIAPPDMCNGLTVPVVACDQIYSFDRDALIKAIPRPQQIATKDFAPAAEELFSRIMQMTDNAGATDEHRALNYLAVRYARIYATVAEAFARNESLTAVDVRPSPLSGGARKVLDVIFSFTHRTTDVVTKYYARVDLTEEFPFLVSQIAPWYDR
jgi:PatG C-terminal